MLYSYKMLQKQSKAFHTYLWRFFPSLKQNFIAYRSSKVSDCIFEIHLLWQSGFSRVYSNSCCSCSFEAEIIKIGHSSHKMYSNNILNSQEFTTILNADTKKVCKLIVCTSYIYWILSFIISSFFFFLSNCNYTFQTFKMFSVQPEITWLKNNFIVHSYFSSERVRIQNLIFDLTP